ncbi:MAG: AAA family ATPase [Deltaproteobacteria bacterium]|jgi:transcriptional regulator with XRE-family HTH domain|nr:AAA family ATPase [Deltaproteobacteria bacterium]
MKNPDEDAKAFAAFLKAEINKLGFGTQAKLSTKSGVSKTMISDILCERTKGRPMTRRKLSDALGIDYETALEQGRNLLESKKVVEAMREGQAFNLNGIDVPPIVYMLAENRELRLRIQEMEQLLGEEARKKLGLKDMSEPEPPKAQAPPEAETIPEAQESQGLDPTKTQSADDPAAGLDTFNRKF